MVRPPCPLHRHHVCGILLHGTSLSPTATTSTERSAFTLTLTTHHATGRGVGSLLLDVGSRDNLSWEVERFGGSRHPQE